MRERETARLKRDSDGRWVTEHSGQDGCIKVGVCVRACVGGCYIGRKPNQPVHLIRSLTAREGEWHKEKDSERERALRGTDVISEHQKNSLKCS